MTSSAVYFKHLVETGLTDLHQVGKMEGEVIQETSYLDSFEWLGNYGSTGQI